ncbi:MAG: cshB [Planctomycetaceae bacterium]|nr:cshB [Planctomycetaceae bacterium]
MALESFHPLIQRWFQSRFAGPTEPQREGWPHIAAGRDTLIAAPTGSGKTLTAFLAAIDRLLKLSVAGELHDTLRVIYVSPLRALSNDMQRNLQTPLDEIFALAAQEGLEIAPIRVGLRTGDTPAKDRAAMTRRPPHILVTTPESLYLLLTGKKSRERMRHVETVIVDEIHALVRDKRGSHLSLSLERLVALCERPPQRVGLSATQRPIELTAEFLIGARPVADAASVGVQVATDTLDQNTNADAGSVGHGTLPTSNGKSKPATKQRSLFSDDDIEPLAAVSQPLFPPIQPIGQSVAERCVIIDVGHRRQLDLAIETPLTEIGAVCTHEQWAEVHEQIIELIKAHRSTLIFVNTRRLAERVTHQLSELLGPDQVSSHHGSLSAKSRQDTELRLKFGQLKAVVATASLELGLDVGYIDLVIQIGSPRAIATFLQRVGRSGHALGLIPKGRLFALTRDELIESMAVIRAVRQGILDKILIPEAPLDILAQQIVAEVAHQDWQTDDLFALVRRAYPYRNLPRAKFDAIVHMLSEGIATATGRSRIYVHHDQVGRRLRARKGAGIAAVMGGGAIPEIATYRVVAEPDNTVVGSLDEDFAVESTRGDVFLLGNTSWRIMNVRGGDVNVVDAGGAPPTIPFWFGEAPGRTLELSAEVSRLREDLSARVIDPVEAENWLVAETSCKPEAAKQTVLYVTAQKAAIGLVPTQKQVVFERFFDESGGMQLVIHAPFGGRITRAWGMAMRKRFCRSFDFELQATADDDGIILSLGPQHSFPLESMFAMLNPQNARNLLEQAVLANPMYQTRWRWNVIRALQVMRSSGGKKVPPPLLRFRSDDLLTAVFPKLTGCKEEIVGDIPVPDHPLAQQTMEDCMFEALDIQGLQDVLQQVVGHDITLVPRDTREPSPFCYELLNANPYAFLDGGELQERRTRAVNTRRSLTVESVSDLGRLDPLAIERVRREAQPLIRDADELHDAMLSRILLPLEEGEVYTPWFNQLANAGRATTVTVTAPEPEHAPSPRTRTYWAPTERLPAVRVAYPGAELGKELPVPEGVQADWTDIDARIALVRGYLDSCGPTTAAVVGELLSLPERQVFACLEYLEGEGVILRGRFTPEGVRFVGEQTLTIEHSRPEEDAEQPAADPPIEWCHRRLLARIHRLTLEGLRKEIEPVEVDTFIRFLMRHQGLAAGGRLTGTNGVYQVLGQLQGIDVPAVSWERDLLPARVEKYQPTWLDELCLTGEIGWGRIFPPKRDPDRSRPMASLTRVAPVSIFLREDIVWLTARSPVLDPQTLSSPAQELFELLTARGAMFAADILSATRLLPAQLDDVLGELITQGFVTADGFGGLRRLIASKSSTNGRDSHGLRRGAVRTRQSTSGVGRWSLWRTAADPALAPESLTEQWAWQLLRRWGVMFRDLLTREAGAPQWWELVQVYRRLEARGEIRGGRFITGVAGEQFALGDTIRTLRQLRDEPGEQELVVISGADPLNLVGIITQHPRVISTASNRVAYLNGKPLAALQGGEVLRFSDIPREIEKVLAEKFRLEFMEDSVLAPEVTPPAVDNVPPPVPPSVPRDSKPKRASGPRYPNSIPRPRIS